MGYSYEGTRVRICPYSNVLWCEIVHVSVCIKSRDPDGQTQLLSFNVTGLIRHWKDNQRDRLHQHDPSTTSPSTGSREKIPRRMHKTPENDIAVNDQRTAFNRNPHLTTQYNVTK